LTDISVSVQDGSYHDIDSTADAFREAARTALTEAIQQARPIILEALSLVTVVAPLSLIQAVEVAVTSYGGQPKTISSDPSSRTITASLQASNMGKLITELLRNSDGRVNISSRSGGFRARPEPPDSEVFSIAQK
jgi:elongation factor G